LTRCSLPEPIQVSRVKGLTKLLRLGSYTHELIVELVRPVTTVGVGRSAKRIAFVKPNDGIIDWIVGITELAPHSSQPQTQPDTDQA